MRARAVSSRPRRPAARPSAMAASGVSPFRNARSAMIAPARLPEPQCRITGPSASARSASTSRATSAVTPSAPATGTCAKRMPSASVCARSSASPPSASVRSEITITTPASAAARRSARLGGPPVITPGSASAWFGSASRVGSEVGSERGGVSPPHAESAKAETQKANRAMRRVTPPT